MYIGTAAPKPMPPSVSPTIIPHKSGISVSVSRNIYGEEIVPYRK